MLSVEKTMLYMLSKSDGISAKQFVDIYEQNGYAATYVRNSLSRLKKEGYIDSPSRSLYEITATGRSYIRSINSKPARYNEHWDGTWDIVMIEVPEQQRKKRDQFRASMLQLGFGLFYHSVYVSPWDYRQEVMDQARELGLESNLSIVRGQFTAGLITKENAGNIWPLDQVDALYREKRAWLRETLLPLADEAVRSGDDFRLFLLYLQVGEAVSALAMTDPSLPESLLPEGWLGPEVFAELSDCFVRLAAQLPEDSWYKKLT